MKGFSLHIGVNVADPAHYPGLKPLNAAVNDAKWWEEYARQKGYQATSLHDNEATITRVKSALSKFAEKMKAGDILLLTYSGHGGEISNEKPDSIDREKMDQTWCLFDEQLLDDELYECFQKFSKGTRIVVVADSCHSGTITKVPGDDLTKLLEEGMSMAKESIGILNRHVPEDVQREIMNGNENTYRSKIEKYKEVSKRSGINAAVKLLAACQDHQVTYDGTHYGIFTEALAKQLSSGNQPKTAEALISGVKKFYAYPKPNFFQYGSIIDGFDNSMPLDIEIPDAATVSGLRKPQLAPFAGVKAVDDISTGDVDRNAVLVVEVEGGSIDNAAGGKEVKILSNKITAGGQVLTLEMVNIPYRQGWGAAHALQVKLQTKGIKAHVEPVLSFNPHQPGGSSRASSGSHEYMSEWPPANTNPVAKLGWHLDQNHSQLNKAAERVMAKPGAAVRIGHIDTGYLKDNVGLPKKLLVDKARSFVENEDINQAIDKPESGMDGHGTGTLGLLAGHKASLSTTFNEFDGFIGGAPMAEVVPIRISNSVIIWNSSNFSDAIEYALQEKCDVVTMSMAGKPSPKMAKVVNLAYENGLVIVSAASNCWYAGLMQVAPKCVLWPAAFERVIAATGAMYNHQPYDGDFLLKSRMDFTKYMQGSWGPESRMKKALAAYTPNTPWASKDNVFSRSGGGTSSASPQVAAAAALWIAMNREDMAAKGFYEPGNKWKIVEAVRYALFTTAAKDEVFADWRKYYGNGILRADRALDIKVSDLGPLQQSPPAESSFGGFFQIAGSFFKNRRLFRDANAQKPEEEALSLELLQLLQTDPRFFETFSTIDLESAAEVELLLNNPDFTDKVIDSPFASDFLKQAVAK